MCSREPPAPNPLPHRRLECSAFDIHSGLSIRFALPVLEVIALIIMYVGDIEIVEKNTSLVVALFFFTILGIFCVTLRVITRLWLVRNLGLDDVFIVFATVRVLFDLGPEVGDR